MSNPKCQHPGCDRTLWIHDRDDQGNIRYRCPEGHSQRVNPTRTATHFCPDCGKGLKIRMTYKDKVYFKKHECLPTKGSGDSQK